MTQGVGDVVGTRVRRAREQRGWTQQQLVDRLDELGHPMNRVTLAKIERPGSTRSRNVSLVDVLALSAALDIPPTLLFLPLGEEDRVAITPAVVVHPDLAAKWIEGLEPLAREHLELDGRQFAVHPGEWRRAALPLHMFQDLRRRRRHAQHCAAQLQRAERLGGFVDPERTRYYAALLEVVGTLQVMRDHNLRTGGLLSEAELSAMSDFGLDPDDESLDIGPREGYFGPGPETGTPDDLVVLAVLAQTSSQVRNLERSIAEAEVTGENIESKQDELRSAQDQFQHALSQYAPWLRAQNKES